LSALPVENSAATEINRKPMLPRKGSAATARAVSEFRWMTWVLTRFVVTTATITYSEVAPTIEV
jgi:hypothetical protein